MTVGTVQMVVHRDGKVFVRGWGNIPRKVGNMENCQALFTIPFQEPNPIDKQC